MRWPLRNQILIRLLLLLFVTIGAITFANIRSLIRTNQNRELGQLSELVSLLQSSRFPLNDTVLESMKSLSGAEFVVENPEGRTLAKTSSAPALTQPKSGESIETNQVQIDKVVIDSKAYFYQAVRKLNPQRPENSSNTVHIFVPRKTNGEIWWQSSKSPLIIATFILPIVFLLSLAMSNQVTRPLSRFRKQVLDVSEGRLSQIPISNRNDEIGDLNNTINEMASRLRDHEEQLRQNERLGTMVQFGNGIAHHLRNSVTGCKLAVELLADEQKEIEESENYQVALRQLEITNNYLKKFWLLSQTPTDSRNPVELVDLASVLRNVEFLVRPTTRHLDVQLTIRVDPDLPKIEMSHDDAQQLMINLINNAITAASEYSVSGSNHQPPIVEVRLSGDARNGVLFSVADNGEGPPCEIEADIFTPFVTGSREGTGLGLSLVQEIANRCKSTVNWTRKNGWTIFQFQIHSNITPAD